MRRNEGDITFLGMAGRDTQPAMQDFTDTHDLNSIEHAVSEDGSLWSRFGIPYQPAWIFVNDDGTADIFPSTLSEDEVQEQLDKLKAS